jgi:hypothetical protein
VKKGTTAYHIVKFVHSVMDVLDRHNKKGFYIVMDNCRIHHSQFVVDAIIQRGYKPLFMPPYSPFLNPIEECWSKIKKNIRRSPLDEHDQLTHRIAEAWLLLLLTTAFSESSTQKHGTDALPKKFVCANYQNCINKVEIFFAKNPK